MADNDFGRADATRIALEFRVESQQVKNRARSTARHAGTLMVQAVRAHASGRPGPNVVTGEYLNSIGFNLVENGDTIGADVGSDAPQAMRLELGFVGMDSLGRSFHQPPFPHFRPAATEVEPLFMKDNENILGALGR